MVGAIDENSRKLVMEKEELKYLQEASKADMDVIMAMLASGGANLRGIQGSGSGGGREIEDFVRKIRLDNPDLSPAQIMEMLKVERA